MVPLRFFCFERLWRAWQASILGPFSGLVVQTVQGRLIEMRLIDVFNLANPRSWAGRHEACSRVLLSAFCPAQGVCVAL